MFFSRKFFSRKFWWLTGPIPDPDGEGLSQAFFPEERIRLKAVEQIGQRRFRWQKLSSLAQDGKIDLRPRFRRGERVLAYAYTELEVNEARDVVFKMGGDDGIACWLNGKRVHYKPVSRELAVDQDAVPARLEPGKNKILLKVNNVSGDWGFAFRITDRQGKPVDLGRP